MDTAINTYADGFGTWYAQIAIQAEDSSKFETLKRRAQKAIQGALIERGTDLTYIPRVKYVGMSHNPSTGLFYENFKEV